MSTDTARAKPTRIAVVIVLIYLVGVLDIVVGILMIFTRYLPQADGAPSALVVSLFGVAGILLGLATIAFATGISRGSPFSRDCVTVLLLLALILDGVSLGLDPRTSWTLVAAQAVLGAAILFPLRLGAGARYFVAR